MEALMTKLDDHKEGMSDGAYKEMAEAIKRVREEEEEPLFEVAYTATTVTAVCMDFDDEYLNHLMFTHTQHTKIMRIGGQYTAASFENGLLFAARRITDGVLEPIIKPGDQLVNRPPSSTDTDPGVVSRRELSNQVMSVLYTIISVKQYKPKRTRTESP